ncbi:hypothetical protein FNAPI_12300 [Fusarium napiforme]|uniref:Uncharacterized protein n=1 Tax=Fusarium napiforme TaxID=42672 RepID=A0A8H5IET2_9HYPO|nr:hypothetical protein FNAPI_12300 [Fusarium napiforme]
MSRMFRGVKSRPSWYYRVNDLVADRYRRGEENLSDNEPRPEDYDEDLSSVSTFSCASRNGCDYGTDDIWEYHMKLDTEGPDSDKELDKNDPLDIEYLYMKMDRRDRKRELRAQKEWEEEMRKKSEKYREQMNEKLREEKRKEAQKIKVYEDAEKAGDVWRQHKRTLRPWETYEEVATKDGIELKMRYINEIQDALDMAQSLEGTPTPLNLGLMRMFKLWSVDHIKHCPYELAPTMYIEFDSEFDWDKFNQEQVRTLRAGKLSGHIYLLSDDVCKIDNFTPPEYCSTETLNLGTSEEPVYVQFFKDNYLTLKISRETVFANCEEDIPWNAPSFFTYYGISEKDMVDKEQQEEEQCETDEESVLESIRLLF